MTPKKANKAARKSPRKADSAGTIQATLSSDEGVINIGAWRLRRSKELERKTLAVVKAIASAYDIDVPAKSSKAELVRQVIDAEEESLRAPISEAIAIDDGSEAIAALWPEVSHRSRDEAEQLLELAKLLETKLKVSEEKSKEFVLESGIATVSELGILDETACAELATQHKFGPVVASKFRAVCKDIRSGSGVGLVDEGNQVTRSSGHPKPSGTLGPPPKWEKDSRWSSWKERFDDWVYNAQQRHFVDAELYAKLRESFPDTVTSLFYKIRPNPDERTLDRLVEFLKDRYAGWEQIDKREEVAAFRSCTRGNRDLKVFRIEWESLREGCIAKNLIDRVEKDSHWQLLRAANLNSEQTTTVMKAFDLANTDDPEILVRIALEEFGRMERTWEFLKERKNRNDNGNRNAALFAPVKKNIQKKGKGAGKGARKDGKGKGKGKGSKGNTTTETKDCRFGMKCTRADCHFKHPKGWVAGKGNQANPPNGGKPKGKGKGGKHKDWKCPTPDCGVLVFGSKDKCFKCGAQRPAGHQAGTP